ncbi:hypothetical protein BMR1_02g04070 [Babesia microti strain RI]|uniref:Uncharacterized protein n=1 Tax=Babesia microti (strain RI) TaxID=1133968 RepID=I7IGJ3_BABMR|nr:hypothetical protein BMR1_02g04070 [Babesia microti strain RI]CCF73961.1 hypothetical protein BMR1_02g04070 [Babesia microti strain RI]|eukprot:XP_012648570.1 hypothetical protein BMR1_02g04070 [Babesia microti strain RI]
MTLVDMGAGVPGDGEIKPIRQEKTVEIMVEEIREKIVELPRIQYLEKIVEYIKPVIQYKIKEVRRPVYIERVLHVPKILEEEKIIEVPQIKYVERIVEVPTYVYKERIIEVPVPMIRETIIPVLKVHRVEREVEIPTVSFLVDNRTINDDGFDSTNNVNFVSMEVNRTLNAELDTVNVDKGGHIDNVVSNEEILDGKNDDLAMNKAKLMFGFDEHLREWVASWRSWRSWTFTDFRIWANKNIKEPHSKTGNSHNEYINVVDNDEEIRHGRFRLRRGGKGKRNISTDAISVTDNLGISKIPPTKSMIADIAKLNHFTGSCYMRGYVHT